MASEVCTFMSVVIRYAHQQASRNEATRVLQHLPNCPLCAAVLDGIWGSAHATSVTMASASFPLSREEMLQEMRGGIIAGRYRLLRRLGEGTFGEVWLTEDIRDGLPFAMKRVKPEFARFFPPWEEFARVSQLNHPNIVKAFDRGRDGLTTFVVYEYIDGQTLHSRIHDNPPDLLTRLGWMRQLVEALAHMHERGFYHLDLKPANVMVESASNRVCVIDLGASLYRDTAVEHNHGAGTRLYMSPERLAGEGIVDASADVWSLGVILHELLTGIRPFAREEEVGQAEPPSIRTYNPAVSPGIDDIARRCLRHDPALRYRNAGELLVGLRQALSRRSLTTRRAFLAVGGLLTVQGTLVGMVNSPWRKPVRLPEVVATGEVVTLQLDPIWPLDVHDSCHVAPGGCLKIRGSGELRFAPGMRIDCRGKLEIAGDGPEANIILRRLNDDAAWGGVQVRGSGSAGSLFKWVTFEGAGGVRARFVSPELGPNEPAAPIDFDESYHTIGGAVVVAHTSKVRFVGVTFQSNHSTCGGAACLYDVTGISFAKCIFVANEARSDRPNEVHKAHGGAIYAERAGVNIADCVFRENSASERWSCGGAVMCGFRSNTFISGSTFANNFTRFLGGAVYLLSIQHNRTHPDRRLFPGTFANCGFENNFTDFWSVRSKPSSALYVNDGINAVVRGTTFRDDFCCSPLVVAEGQDYNPCRFRLWEYRFDVAVDRPEQQKLCWTPNIDKEEHADKIDIIWPEPGAITKRAPIHDDLLRDGIARRREDGMRAIETVVLYRLWAGNGNSQLIAECHDPEIGVHYVIKRNGRIVRLIREGDVAPHTAGAMAMLEQTSIAVALEQRDDNFQNVVAQVGFDRQGQGTARVRYTFAQYHALDWLWRDLLSRYPQLRLSKGGQSLRRGRWSADPALGFEWLTRR